jgi:hypothetical protein
MPGQPLLRQPMCGAKTRAGHPCRRSIIPGRKRCRNHGGLSTGPRTAEGKARVKAGQLAYWESWRAERVASTRA